MVIIPPAAAKLNDQGVSDAAASCD